jgi:uncharacterized damage-inducible protein DinB
VVDGEGDCFRIERCGHHHQEVAFVDSAGTLLEAFARVRGSVHAVLDGISAEMLTYRVDDQANSIAWLVWHLTRIQDDHLAAVAGSEQAWVAQGWAERFDLPFETLSTGYGQEPQETAIDVSADALLGYYDAVHRQTVGFVAGLKDADLDRVVDESWDPPVTLGVRLVSVIEDDLQHLGQAAYVRGLAAGAVSA